MHMMKVMGRMMMNQMLKKMMVMGGEMGGEAQTERGPHVKIFYNT